MKDFVHIAGPLGISHLFMFSQTERRINFRMGRLPRGPTVSFAVESFTLSRQIKAAQKRPVDLSVAFLSPPLLITSNLNASATESIATASTGVSIGNALKLVHSTLQASFPPLNPATLKLSEVRRVLLAHYNKDTGLVEFRHYIIRAKPVGVSQAISNISMSRVPNLSNVEDIADWVVSRGGYESEAEDETARVTLPQNYAGAGNQSSSLSTIRLTEIGPRMSLRLIKIEGGLSAGEVLYHAFVTKTKKERQELEQRAKEKERLKQERKETQEANVARKAAEKTAKLEKKKQRLAEKERLAKEKAAKGTLGEESDEDSNVASDNEDGSDFEDYASDDSEENVGEHSESEADDSDDGSDEEDSGEEFGIGSDGDEEGSSSDNTDSEVVEPGSKRQRGKHQKAAVSESDEEDEEATGRGGSKNKKGAFIMPFKTKMVKKK